MSGGTLVYDSLEEFLLVDNHHGGFREPGNVYDRSQNAQYVSNVFYDSASPYKYQTIAITWVSFEDTASGAYIEMEARVSEDGSTWSNWFQVPNGLAVNAPFPFRYAQYRATFHWAKPNVLPWLERVTVEFLNPLFQNADEGAGAPEFAVGGGKFLLVNLPSGQAEIYDAAGRLVKSLQGPGSFKLSLKPGVYAVVHEGTVEKALVR